MDEELRLYGLTLCTLQHAVGDSKDNRRQDKQVESHCSEVNIWQHSRRYYHEWVLTVLISVAQDSNFILQKYQVHVISLPKLLEKRGSQSLGYSASQTAAVL